ncbi:hypothetical protein NPIL_155741 [Nephila pilipes]|uniref:Uncharacterized protein n=1 Tax=Nephila pilipes TaxID=299642 RepID=A0A8X6PZ92_NEPPI|nr:hypothetical protein NPIL_155741 [Nephila pilipes]
MHNSDAFCCGTEVQMNSETRVELDGSPARNEFQFFKSDPLCLTDEGLFFSHGGGMCHSPDIEISRNESSR